MKSTAEFLKQIRAIELGIRKQVKKGLSGLYKSSFRGTGVQFKEFRNYVYGDDVRHISWNVSARTMDPVLKTFEEERERTLFLLVDVSASLRKGAVAQDKARRLAEIAGTLAVSATESNDKIGLLLFSDRIESVVPPKKGKNHLLRVIRDIIAFEPKGHGTAPDLALRQIDQVLKKQSIVMLLSDFEVMPNELLLRRAASHHDFAAIGVEHSFEWDYQPWGFLEMESAEKGRPVTIDTSSKDIRDYLSQYGSKKKQQIKENFQRSNIDLLWINCFEDFISPLQSYMQKRGRRG